MILIKNNDLNVKVFAHPVALKGTPLKLIPGINPIEDGEWATVSKDHATIATLLEEGNLEILGDKALTSYPPNKATAAVEEIFDKAFLEDLSKKEKRPKVLAAIMKQIESITFKAEKPKDV